MKITLFVHPKFLGSQSMPRYAKMLAAGMLERGYEVMVWKPKAFFYRLPLQFMKKWLGYIDQYIVFPLRVKQELRNSSKDTLFVFTDQALGPWVSLVKNRPHVIHCHDFLALNSALGNIPENPTGITGKIYQNFIRRGFSKGKHFISISKKTQQDLHELHSDEIKSSVVCYNGLNRSFGVLDTNISRSFLGNYLNIDLSKGYILHIGGNQYYKNRKGVIEIYNAWRSKSEFTLPLLMIGPKPNGILENLYQNSFFKKDIHLISGLEDEFINFAYSGACCLLFPSLDEGFGWPIVEAMACGCPVITTNRAPMNEVVGMANFFLIDRRPFDETIVNKWAIKASYQITKILNLSDSERVNCINIALKSNQRFDAKLFLDEIEKYYLRVLKY
ncbi:glycosyltransferase [Flavobacterium restrictum]|uniref:Glycosyltransferase family 4 protein n=1 Tax=Flavobacterium restrictum TaxID=2594428 RepID=A0A553E510_9FLAO|nr:glycosyltransferase [Flavobacterium restrictum]TRX40117.1 glycosyltransferase family 4 protein [Flavobacterium restrictum]